MLERERKFTRLLDFYWTPTFFFPLLLLAAAKALASLLCCTLGACRE